MSHRISTILIAICLLTAGLWAQTPLPLDGEVRKGKLGNGMTYFIRNNTQTPGQADFYIVNKVGSILEEPAQRGLAHFLEHMAFNGTEHFPDPNDGKRSIRLWCERHGIKFGADLNASTSVEQTIYKICNAPVHMEGVADTCLLILHDWSHSLLLKESEIDKERAVICEEWRSRRSGFATQRMMEDAVSAIYKGSKYEDCLPIGNMDVVMNFKPEVLRSFYDKWYRPDLQAVIVVGDVDQDLVERKIKDLFSAISMPQDPAPRTIYPVPDNEKMIVFTKQDEEQPTVNLSLYMKGDDESGNEAPTLEEFRKDYLSRLAMFMLRQRMQTLTQDAEPRVMSSSVRHGNFYISSARTAFSLNIGLLPARMREGISTAIAIVEKSRRFGFTEDELDRAKQQFTLSVEHKRGQKGKMRNAEHVSKIVRHFLDNEALMDIDYEADAEAVFEEEVTLEEVNSALREIITNRNQVCIVYGPVRYGDESFSLPQGEEIASWIEEAQKMDYADDFYVPVTDRTYIRKLPKKGVILSRKESTNGYTRYLLSNGIRVYARPSSLEPGRLTLKMFRHGGKSLYGDEDAASMNFINSVIANSGAGGYDVITLEKKRAGKALRVTPFINSEEEGVEGVCASTDFKTWLELSYLYLTDPRFDKAVFSNMMRRQESMLRNRTANPDVTYRDSIRAAIYGQAEKTRPMTLERLGLVSHERIYEIYKERFSDLGGMSLIVTGDIREDEFEQLICQYVASLPGKRNTRMERPGDNIPDARRADEEHIFHMEQKTPAAKTTIAYTLDIPYTAENDLRMDVLSQLLRATFTDKVREDKGGVYGVSVSSQCWKYPSEAASLTISFTTSPDKYDMVSSLIYEIIGDMAKNGPEEEDLERVREYEYKNYDRAVLTNNYWEYVKYHEIAYGVDFDKDYRTLVSNLSTADIRDICRKMVDDKNRIHITMK